MRWCVVHDAQVDVYGEACWKSVHLVGFEGVCDPRPIEEDPIMELERLDDPALPIPEGWVLQFDSGAVRMISRTVGYRRVLPVVLGG